jgi:hypothetical protein
MRQVGDPLLDVLHNDTVIRNLPLCVHAIHHVGFLRQRGKRLPLTSLDEIRSFGIPSLCSG